MRTQGVIESFARIYFTARLASDTLILPKPWWWQGSRQSAPGSLFQSWRPLVDRSRFPKVVWLLVTLNKPSNLSGSQGLLFWKPNCPFVERIRVKGEECHLGAHLSHSRQMTGPECHRHLTGLWGSHSISTAAHSSVILQPEMQVLPIRMGSSFRVKLLVSETSTAEFNPFVFLSSIPFTLSSLPSILWNLCYTPFILDKKQMQ